MMLVRTERLTVRIVEPDDHVALRDYYLENADHLRPFEPQRETGFHDADAWRNRALEMSQRSAEGAALSLVAIPRDESRIVGICNFSNLVRGPFQACNVGFSIDRRLEGRGLMFEMLSVSLDFVFQDLDFHRVMANHLPENARSAHLLARLGFEREGYARSYLKIAGCWRDHVLTSKINPDHS